MINFAHISDFFEEFVDSLNMFTSISWAWSRRTTLRNQEGIKNESDTHGRSENLAYMRSNRGVELTSLPKIMYFLQSINIRITVTIYSTGS